MSNLRLNVSNCKHHMHTDEPCLLLGVYSCLANCSALVLACLSFLPGTVLIPKTSSIRFQFITAHRQMIELAHGCNHMKCRCGTEFCYQCGAEYRGSRAGCNCDLWDERMLLAEEQRQRQQAVVHGSAFHPSSSLYLNPCQLTRASAHSATHPDVFQGVCKSVTNVGIPVPLGQARTTPS